MKTDEFIALCEGVPIVETADKSRIPQLDIRNLLSDTSKSQMSYQEIKDLRTGLIYLSIIDAPNKSRYEYYFYLLEKITIHFNDSTKQIVSWTEHVWKDVLSNVKQLSEYPKTNAFTHEEFRKQERERAFAAKRLIKYGLNVSVVDNDLAFENLDTIYHKVETLASSIGGMKAIDLMLHDEEYNSMTGRINIRHGGNMPLPSMVELEKPYGYLLNLFLKYIEKPTTSINSKRDYQKLVSIATDLCLAVYNVQKFDIWTDVFAPDQNIVEFIHRMVIRFDLYTLPQTGTSFTSTWCKYLIKQISSSDLCDNLMRQQLAYTIKIMNWAMTISQNKQCVELKKTDKTCSILNRLPTACRNCIVVEASAVNRDFSTPIDYKNVNGMMHPIYSTTDAYILLPKPLAAWNWYEAIYNIIKRNSILAGKIGTIIESFVHDKMHSNGINSHTGEYSYDTENGDLDVLVEASKGDAIIECKKKDLSRDARKGDNHFIWSDLKDVIHSQMQCAKAENGVRNFSPLKLNLKGADSEYQYQWLPTYTVHEDNGTTMQRERIISRVTLTLKEYGPMQDKVILSNVFRNLVGKQIGSTFSSGTYDADDIKNISAKFSEINKILTALYNYYAALHLDHPTFFCRFYSLEQLYFLIRISADIDDFFELLARNYASTGTENFWNEYENLKRMQ